MGEFRTLQELRDRLVVQGDDAALIGFAGDIEEVWSFAQLAAVSAQIAHGLLLRGVAQGERMVLAAPNSCRWILTFWGVIAAGAVAVPVDPQTADAELARMLVTVDCRFAFTTAAMAPRLRAIAPSCRLFLLDTDDASAEGEPWRNLLATGGDLPRATATGDAVIVFTSGTTGTPKAVPLTHQNLLTNVGALAVTGLVGPGDRVLLPLPLFHAYPLTIGMLTPLALGCGVILPGGISGPELVGAMRTGRATALLGVPRLYAALHDNLRRTIAALPRWQAAVIAALFAVVRRLRHYGMAAPGRILLRPLRRRLASDLRLLVSGGAPIALEVETALATMGWQILTGYGLVETSSMLTFNPPEGALAGSAGKPVPGMELRIVNPGADGVGEIETRGPSLFRGYLGDPVKTSEAFTSDGWFRTGDLGWIDAQGYLHIAARKAETIVLADGKKLFPEEFEAVYATAPLIRELALLGRNGALVALVVPDLVAAREFGGLRLGDAIREGLAAKAQTLPSHARLSGFAISNAALPRTQLGKIRRHLLEPLYEAALRHEPSAAPSALSAEDQALLASPSAGAVWRWLQARFPDRPLQLDTMPQIDLAIDSLGWVDLTLALERDLGIVMKESAIARVVTLRDLLRAAAAGGEADKPAALPREAEIFLEPLDPALGLLRALGEILLRWTLRRFFGLRCEGLELLPREDPILLCPNHVSYLDPFALGAALPRARLRHTCWGGWTGVAFTTGLRRLFSRAARIIPVDPDRATASGLALAGIALERGWNLVWFPEGGRSSDGELQRFLPGVGALASAHPVPIVPVHIEGSFAAWPPSRKYPRRHPVTIRFGPPLDPESLSQKPAGRDRDIEIAAAIEARVAALGTQARPARASSHDRD